MFSYLKLDATERERVIEILRFYITTDKNKIVKTFSMQTLADFAETDAGIRPEIIGILEGLVKTGSPAMVSRGNKLLIRLMGREHIDSSEPELNRHHRR